MVLSQFGNWTCQFCFFLFKKFTQLSDEFENLKFHRISNNIFAEFAYRKGKMTPNIFSPYWHKQILIVDWCGDRILNYQHSLGCFIIIIFNIITFNQVPKLWDGRKKNPTPLWHGMAIFFSFVYENNKCWILSLFFVLCFCVQTVLCPQHIHKGNPENRLESVAVFRRVYINREEHKQVAR